MKDRRVEEGRRGRWGGIVAVFCRVVAALREVFAALRKFVAAFRRIAAASRNRGAKEVVIEDGGADGAWFGIGARTGRDV